MNYFLLMVGHGRALELFLGLLKIGLAIWIIITGASAQIPVLADLSWYYSPVFLASPLFVVGACQLFGWTLNCMGYEFSWLLRAIGAQVAIFMWFWYIFKTPFANASSPIFVLAVLALPFSTLLLYKAWNRLPIPGASGAR